MWLCNWNTLYKYNGIFHNMISVCHLSWIVCVFKRENFSVCMYIYIVYEIQSIIWDSDICIKIKTIYLKEWCVFKVLLLHSFINVEFIAKYWFKEFNTYTIQIVFESLSFISNWFLRIHSNIVLHPALYNYTISVLVRNKTFTLNRNLVIHAIDT